VAPLVVDGMSDNVNIIPVVTVTSREVYEQNKATSDIVLAALLAPCEVSE
jgi:hypothetical protein